MSNSLFPSPSNANAAMVEIISQFKTDTQLCQYIATNWERIFATRKATLYLIKESLIPYTKTTQIKLQNILNVAKKHRRNCLIAKTAASAAGAIGTAVTFTGIILAGPTLGVSLLITAPVGIATASLGALTSVGTFIVDEFFLRKDVMANLLALQEMYELVKKGFLDSFADDLLNEFEALCHADKSVHLDNILEWLEMKEFHDEKIAIEDIKAGDHIYRRSMGFTSINAARFHYGVCIGRHETTGVMQVADFGADCDCTKIKMGSTSCNQLMIRSLQDFIGKSKTIYRRDYKDSAAPVQETIDLVKNIVNQGNWEDYKLFSNKCEHFATYLKLEQNWSGQNYNRKKVLEGLEKTTKVVDGAFVGLNGVNLAKILNAGDEIVGAAGNGVVNGAQQAFKLGGVSIALMALGPVMMAIDIGLLTRDYLVLQPNIRSVEAYLKIIDRDLAAYQKLVDSF